MRQQPRKPVVGMKVHFLLLSLLLLATLMLGISVVSAVAQTISVDAGQEEVATIDLNVDDKVFGRISVIGDSDDDIYFFVTDPDGKDIVQRKKVIVEDFRFTASKEGAYRLHFDNTFSDEEKTVSFNYDVRHFIFGIPQEDFLVYAIMIVGMIGLVLFAALSRQ